MSWRFPPRPNKPSTRTRRWSLGSPVAACETPQLVIDPQAYGSEMSSQELHDAIERLRDLALELTERSVEDDIARLGEDAAADPMTLLAGMTGVVLARLHEMANATLRIAEEVQRSLPPTA